MRIQHNIMAMSAYRNYNTNTSAVAKNLEKLSSGYKINRAGDDAAGLAISEKMRAQITGLNAAQKNVKDGISLVKTAEGAMQEIQDMLNRMDYLATQSANGTYDNEVDRANLQKEVDALKTEINRIADSANFNGIKLLDGSLDSSAVEASTSTGAGKLPNVGEILGKDTVLHKDPGALPEDTTFSVDLHNLEISGTKGQEFTLEIGDLKLVGTLQQDYSGDTKLMAADIADALGNGTDTNVKFEVEAEDGTRTAYDNTQVNFGESTFAAEVSGTRVTFTHDGASEEIESPDMEVKVSTGGAFAKKIATTTQTKVGKDAVGDTQSTYTASAAPTANPGLALSKSGNQYTVTIGGKAYDVTTTSNAESESDLVDKWIAAFNADTANNGYVASKSTNDLVITFAGDATKTAADFQALGVTGGAVTAPGADSVYTITGAIATGTPTVADKTGVENKYTVTVDGKALDVTGALDSTAADLGAAWAEAANADATLSAKFTAAADATGVVTLTAKEKGTEATSGIAETDTGLTNGTWTEGADIAAVQAESEIDFTGKTGQDIWGGTITIGTGDDAKVYQFVEDTADVAAGNEAVVVGKDDDAEAIAAALAGAAAPTDVTLAAAGGKVTVAADAAGTVDGAAGNAAVKVAVGKAGADPTIKGDYNVSTTVIAKKSEAGNDRIASTYFDLTKEMVTNGSKIQIGNEKYTFSTNEADKGKDGVVYTGDLDASSADYMTEVAERLTVAAKNNDVYTVGHDGKRMSFTENTTWNNDDPDSFDLRTYEGVEKSFGFEIAGKAADESRALTLQIGDTSDDFNQMKVKVGDMHTSAMGIADIDISTQAGASSAVQTIKDAINYVSGVRGDLGAVQNRLEHTANNLSVMAENIQDAESTIRDTDIAEEMMAYTKNNILVQSAQAMLAQANQVPQGVLQLLG